MGSSSARIARWSTCSTPRAQRGSSGRAFQVRAYVDLLLTDAAYQRHRGETQKCADLAVRAEAFLGTLPKSDEDRDRHGRVAALLRTEPYR
ncbi:MAG: hypothetical protein DRJ42_25925 [Deltaproteobacteria bacterium]|nr:MAG: hypothetical protein DRJ42_25925 [Deltaproteobacteria bacterium]